MGYLEFKKQAGIGSDIINGVAGWAADKWLGSRFGFGSQEEYQRRQNVYNDIKNKPDTNKDPYTVTGTTTQNTIQGQKSSATRRNPNHVIQSDAFNNDRINNISDAATRDAYTDFVLKGGAFAQQLQDTNYDPSKLNLNDIKNNPNVVNSIGAALENASPASLDSFMRIGQQYEKMQQEQSSSTTAASGGTIQPDSAMTKIKDQLTGSFLKGMWKNIKANPIQMIPQAASMFLRYLGAGESVAGFAADPMKFYLSMAGILLGGGLLLSGAFGGGGANQPQQIVINNGPQTDPRMQRVPYGI